MDDVPDRALRFIRTHGLLSAGEPVVLAFSGGPDSVALALALLSLRDDGRLPMELSLAHLNHALRGEESERDEAFCRAFAEQRALPIVVERADVQRHAAGQRLSIEAAARELRYGFLGRAAEAADAAAVATGHQADDVAETVLLRLLRGAGIHALGAIAPVRVLADDRPHTRLVRPLLEVPRADLLAYLSRQGQGYCTDSTNRDTGLTRNRVRHVLMPFLQREFPSFSPGSLAGVNSSALEAAALSESLLDERWPRLCVRESAGDVVLDQAQLAALPPPLRKAAGLRAFRALCTPPVPALRAAHMEELARLPERRVGACVALPRGILAHREHGRVRLAAGRIDGWPARALPAPGEVEVPEIGLRIEAAILPPGSMAPADAAAEATATEVYLDLARTGASLCVRTRKPGDRFHPLGAPGQAKLKEFFINRKVPQGDRDLVPLVVTEDEALVWVAGHRIGEPFRLRDARSSVLHLRAVPTGEPAS